MQYCVLGGAGFIGSYLVKMLLAAEKDCVVTVYDNFSSGRMWHFDGFHDDSRLRIVRGDIKDVRLLTDVVRDKDIVYHFASNPDIAKAVMQPDIDFWEGTYLTNNVLEAMRKTGVRKLFYASGSGVYGDTGMEEAGEEYAPMLPVSTYGASKLACEALISAYCHMFDLSASAFRFANVVGPHQTHGVGHDFVVRLMNDSHELCIRGDGTQSKSYIYVSDAVQAMRLVEKKEIKGFSYFNVSSKDYITVKEIADIVIDVMGLKNVLCSYTGGKRGWQGDVPVVRLNSDKIRDLGWENAFSTKEAVHVAVQLIYKDAQAGKFNQP